MVRGPASLLRRGGPAAAPLAALAYFLAAPAFPSLPAGDATVVVAGGIGLLLVAGTALSLLALRDAPASLSLILLGAGLIAGALNAAGVGAAANVLEALVAAAGGLLLARSLDDPRLLLAVPVFVALIDIWSVASGPTERLLDAGTDASDVLSFDMPAWGGHGSAGHLGLADAIFLALFAAWAWRHALRRTATIAGLLLGVLASLVLGLVLDEAIPALPLIAAGFLLPNADRIARLPARTRPAR